MPRTAEQIEELSKKLSSDLQRFHEESQSLADKLADKIGEKIEAATRDLHRKGRRLHVWAILLGLGGVIFGFDAYFLQRTLRSSIDRIDSSEKTTDITVKKIESSVSTRFVGSWPYHFKEVTDLIDRAATNRDHVLVLGDFVGAWHYTQPPQYFDKYLRRLTDSQIQADMLVFDRRTAIDRLTKQFNDHDAEEAKTNGRFCDQVGVPSYCTQVGYYEAKPLEGKDHFDKYNTYLTFWEGKGFIHPGERPTNYLGFLTLLLRVQDRLCADFNQHSDRIHIWRIPEEESSQLKSAMYFYWITRNKEMVLSFRRYNDINLGSAFFTTKAELVNEFTAQWDARLREKGVSAVYGDHCYANHELKVVRDKSGAVRLE